VAESLQAGAGELFPCGLEGFAGRLVWLGGEGFVADPAEGGGATRVYYFIPNLFLPQRHRWLQMRGAAGGQQACSQSDGAQQDCSCQEHICLRFEADKN
jgi:hypothetical protein